MLLISRLWKQWSSYSSHKVLLWSGYNQWSVRSRSSSYEFCKHERKCCCFEEWSCLKTIKNKSKNLLNAVTSENAFTLFPLVVCQFGTPCRFPFIWGMVFALNLKMPSGTGLIDFNSYSHNSKIEMLSHLKTSKGSISIWSLDQLK